VPLGAVSVLSWCGEVSLGGIQSSSEREKDSLATSGLKEAEVNPIVGEGAVGMNPPGYIGCPTHSIST